MVANHDDCVRELMADVVVAGDPYPVDLRVIEEIQTEAEAEDEVLVAQVMEEVVNVFLGPDVPLNLDTDLLP